MRILSAFNSHVHLLAKCKAALLLSPKERADAHAHAVKRAAADAVRGNSGTRGRSSGGMGGGSSRRSSSPPMFGHGMSGSSGSSSSSSSSVGNGGGSGGVRSSRRGVRQNDGDGKFTIVDVPVSLINLVVHADQRRAPLRMFHFADALPSSPPPPPPPPAHDTPSPRRSRPAMRSRESGELGLLPTTREGVAAVAGGIVRGSGGLLFPGVVSSQGATAKKADGKQEAAATAATVGMTDGGTKESSPHSVPLCATCEVAPVVRIDEETRGSGNGGDGSKNGESTTKEGDMSANAQVSTGQTAMCALEREQIFFGLLSFDRFIPARSRRPCLSLFIIQCLS